MQSYDVPEGFFSSMFEHKPPVLLYASVEGEQGDEQPVQTVGHMHQYVVLARRFPNWFLQCFLKLREGIKDVNELNELQTARAPIPELLSPS